MAVVIRNCCLLVFLFLAIAQATAKSEKPLTAVADLRYGVALYHYYQADYLDALTELMVAKARGGIQGHGDNPQLMEGGFALAYGLERYASDVFADVLAANVPEKAQVAAWFYLARMLYMRGDWESAQRAIDELKKIAGKKRRNTDDIASDLDALKISLAIKQNDLEAAEKIYKQKRLGDDWLPYVHFNLGSAAAREQEWDKAIRYFNKIADKKFPDEEYRSLFDKAMIAAGYSYLLSDRQEKAMERFSHVRLDSPLSGRALLGYGWAAAERENYREALRVWNHLSESSLIDENSQEALVAVPYAYEKLGLAGLALQKFQAAERGFYAEMKRLDEVIANLKGDTLLEALKISDAGQVNWLAYAESNQLAPQVSYLIALFAREEFQMRVKELRDLLAVQKNTREWQEKLYFYSAMLDTRERDRADQSALLARDSFAKRILELQQTRDALALKIETIAAEKDYFALAAGDDADLVMRVQRAKRYVPLLADEDPFIEDTEEAVRRYYGMMLWESAEKFSDRLWTAIKSLNALDETIAEIKRNHSDVARILSAAPDLQPYREKISAASLKLEAQSAAVDTAVDMAKEELRREVVGTLTEQRARIQHYLAQSRLSVARLFDKALKERQAVISSQEDDASENNALPEEDSDAAVEEEPPL